ncbi:MAG: dUTP diphosphatase [Alphaproteobacteria bacterium]|nr:dUTP diphosphatase [Alphaproteobacteria bacterium]
MELSVSIKILPHAEGLPLPAYATVSSAGMDLMAAISEEITLAPHARMLVPTGIAIALPEGFEAQVRPRSGLAYKNGITVLNAPGTIDADYRGEVKVLLVNTSQEAFIITHGMRIAQLVIAAYQRISWNAVVELDESSRGQGGFGSTGVDQLSKNVVTPHAA